jgi:hypothetical protein
VSVDDDDLSWMHNANAEIAARDVQPTANSPEQDAATFVAWRKANGWNPDDDFELQGQTPEEVASQTKGE